MNLRFKLSLRGILHPFHSKTWKSAISLLLIAQMGSLTHAQPAQDPAYEGPPIGLINGLEAQHPRLLFDAARFAEIKAYYESPENTGIRQQLEEEAEDARAGGFSTTITSSEGESKIFGTSRIPTLALHFLLTGEQASLDSAITHLDYLARLDPWSGGDETNSGMPAGNLLQGAAIGYDMLYDYLPERLHSTLTGVIWQKTRAMYYRGFLESGNNGSSYWRADPQNNHRFHRVGGLVLGALAIYNGSPSQDWMLSKAIEELNFVIKYLPPDGSNHESINYINYGHEALMMASFVAEQTLGTPYLKTPYIKNTPLFITSAMVPGFSNRFRYGDDSGGSGLSQQQWLPVTYNQLANVQALIDFKNYSGGEAWWNLVSHLDKPTGGSIENLPKNTLFPDLGISFFHEGWEPGQVGAMFKSSPLGGHRLNEYRDDYNFHYINVAHDDPDANTFMIWDGEYFAIDSDEYSYSKKTSSHNTILVNNRGQSAQGRSDGVQWTQPATSASTMQNMAYVTNWKDAGDIALSEGEAGGAYPTTPLTRYRRAFIWNSGKYVFLFDDIRAQSNTNIKWLAQSRVALAVDQAAGIFRVGNNRKIETYVRLVSNHTPTFNIGTSTADNRGGNLNNSQIQADFSGIQNLQIASLFLPWEDKDVTIALDSIDDDHATITITGQDFEDVWSWTAATDSRSPGSFTLISDSEQSFESTPDPWLETFPGFSYQNGPWLVSNWFGAYSPKHFPWIYSDNLAWLYTDQSSNWFWSLDQGWIWLREDYYPWVYSNSSSTWVNTSASNE